MWWQSYCFQLNLPPCVLWPGSLKTLFLWCKASLWRTCLLHPQPWHRGYVFQANEKLSLIIISVITALPHYVSKVEGYSPSSLRTYLNDNLGALLSSEVDNYKTKVHVFWAAAPRTGWRWPLLTNPACLLTCNLQQLSQALKLLQLYLLG